MKAINMMISELSKLAHVIEFLKSFVEAFKNGFKAFMVWLLCLLVGFIPVFLKHLSYNEGAFESFRFEGKMTSHYINFLFKGMLQDLDFLFVFVGALCTLCIQIALEKDQNQKPFKICSFAWIGFVLLLVEYILLSILPVYKAATFDGYYIVYNQVLLPAVLCFSMVTHLVIAYKKEKNRRIEQ